MGRVDVTWVQNLQFVGTDSGKHSVVLSGSGPDDGTGMKPSEMLLISLGGCTGYDVVNILRKKRQKLTGLRVSVSGEQAAELPWAFETMHIHYEVTGRGLDPAAVEQAIKLSEEKYCSVSATLGKSVAITYDYTIIDEEA
ncbi:MAG: OsmC family protein [Anaerolineae bacterium]|nr:OsmC family protein [Anaerolineae bacterium]